MELDLKLKECNKTRDTVKLVFVFYYVLKTASLKSSLSYIYPHLVRWGKYKVKSGKYPKMQLVLALWIFENQQNHSL